MVATLVKSFSGDISSEILHVQNAQIRVGPVAFLNLAFRVFTQSFTFIESVILFFQLDLLCFNLVLLFFLRWIYSILTQSFSFIKSSLPFSESDVQCFNSVFLIFFTQTFPILSQSFPFIFNASFSFLSVLRFDLIAICTADTIKDGVVYRKCSLHYHERKLNQSSQRN